MLSRKHYRAIAGQSYPYYYRPFAHLINPKRHNHMRSVVFWLALVIGMFAAGFTLGEAIYLVM